MLIDRGRTKRKNEQWLMVLRMVKQGVTYQAIGNVLAISQQRVCQIVQKSKKHAARWDDDLARQIKELVQ